MKKYAIFLLICLLSAPAFAEYDIIESDEGQQAVFDENSRLTVFRDDVIKTDDPICVYLDSSLLDSEGYNKLEWYYLDTIDKHYITIRVNKSDLKLPSYVLMNEEESTISVPLSGLTSSKGVFKAHGVPILVTVTGTDSINAEIKD